MPRFDFTITIGCDAETSKEAWLEAVAELALNPEPMPDEYTESEN